jgi:hypothetical protein
VAGSDGPTGRAGVNGCAWSATGRKTNGNRFDNPRTCATPATLRRHPRTDSSSGSGPSRYGRADSDCRQRRRTRGVFKPRRHTRRMGASALCGSGWPPCRSRPPRRAGGSAKAVLLAD